jgi:hypothetical protein
MTVNTVLLDTSYTENNKLGIRQAEEKCVIYAANSSNHSFIHLIKKTKNINIII